jgi:hypothetical protein
MSLFFLLFALLFSVLVGCREEVQELQVVLHYPSRISFSNIQIRLLTPDKRNGCLWQDQNSADFTFAANATPPPPFSRVQKPTSATSAPLEWVCVVARTEDGKDWIRLVPVTLESYTRKVINVFLAPHQQTSGFRRPGDDLLSGSQEWSLNEAGTHLLPLEHNRLLLSGGISQFRPELPIKSENLSNKLRLYEPGTGQISVLKLALENARAFHLTFRSDSRVLVCGGIRSKSQPYKEAFERMADGSFKRIEQDKSISDDEAKSWFLLGASWTRLEKEGKSYFLVLGGVFVKQAGAELVDWRENKRLFLVPLEGDAPCNPATGLDSKGRVEIPKSWKAVETFSQSRIGHTAHLLNNEHLVVFGGLSGCSQTAGKTLVEWLQQCNSTTALEPLSLNRGVSLESWDVTTIPLQDQSTRSQLQRAFHTTAFFGKSRFLLVGGIGDTAFSLKRDTLLFEWRTDHNHQFTVINAFHKPTRIPRFFHVSAVLEYGPVFLWGGTQLSTKRQGFQYMPLPAVWGVGGSSQPPPEPGKTDGDALDGGTKEIPLPDDAPDDSGGGDNADEPPSPDQSVPEVQPPKLTTKGLLRMNNHILGGRIARTTLPSGGFLLTGSFLKAAISTKAPNNMEIFVGGKKVSLKSPVEHSSTTLLQGNVSILARVDKSGGLVWIRALIPKDVVDDKPRQSHVIVDNKGNIVLLTTIYVGNSSSGSNNLVITGTNRQNNAVKLSNSSISNLKKGFHLVMVRFDRDGKMTAQKVLSSTDVGSSLCASPCYGEFRVKAAVYHARIDRLLLAGDFRGYWEIKNNRGGTIGSLNNKTRRPVPYLLAVNISSFAFEQAWQMNRRFVGGEYLDEFQVVLSDMDWNPRDGSIVLAGQFSGEFLTTGVGDSIKTTSKTASVPFFAFFVIDQAQKAFALNQLKLVGGAQSGVSGSWTHVRFDRGANRKGLILQGWIRQTGTGAVSVDGIQMTRKGSKYAQIVLSRWEETTGGTRYLLKPRGSYQIWVDNNEEQALCPANEPCVLPTGLTLYKDHALFSGHSRATLHFGSDEKLEHTRLQMGFFGAVRFTTDFKTGGITEVARPYLNSDKNDPTNQKTGYFRFSDIYMDNQENLLLLGDFNLFTVTIDQNLTIEPTPRVATRTAPHLFLWRLSFDVF